MNVDFHFKTPEVSPGYMLWQVSMQWQKLMNQALSPLDITHTQFVLLAALAWLSKNQETISQTDIANQSNTDRMMVSKVIRKLESKGMIERKDHPSDPRAKSIKLTKEGGEHIQKALNVVESMDVAYFQSIETTSDQFLSQLNILLKSNQHS